MGVAGVNTSTGVSSDLQTLLAGRDTRWYKGHLRKLTAILLLILITSATNGYDGSMMNGLQALDTWKTYFDNPQKKTTLFGVFNAIQNIGSICGLPFAPYVADLMGRRFSIFLGCCIMLVGTAVQTGSQNIGMFIAARGLIGFGLSFAGLAAPILITELAFPTHRGPITSLYNSSWYLGAIVAAWTTFGTFRMTSNWGWRIPSLLQGLPSILQLIFIWWIPESPRWLVSKGRDDQAAAIIGKYHCGGDMSDPLIAFEMQEIREMITAEQNQGGWKELFTGKANLRRLRIIVAISFFSQWSGNGLVSYYLSLILSSIGITSADLQTLINGILQLWNYFWAIMGALTVDRFGRRPLFLWSTAGMCVAYICWTICSAIYAKSGTKFDPACIAAGGDRYSCVASDANNRAGGAVIAFIFIYYAFYDIGHHKYFTDRPHAMSPLLVSYTVEILPFNLRAKGMMLMNLCVSASLVFNQYVNPIAIAALHWKYYIVFCVFLAFEFVYCYCWILETRGKNGPLPLEEIAVLFEGPSAWGFQKRNQPGHVDDVEYAATGYETPEKLGEAQVEHVARN